MKADNPIEKVLRPAIEARELAGAAALVWRDGTLCHVATVGQRDLVSAAPVERDTIFRIASMTKPITTVCALTLLDEGRFDLDWPITECAPELTHMRVLRDPNGPLDQSDEAMRPITFRDLLTHRSGLTYGDLHRGPIGRAYEAILGPTIDNPLSPDEWIARLATLPLVDHPGAGFHYGHSTDLLGFLVARLERAPLSTVIDERVLTPLGMRDSCFAVPTEKRERSAGLCGFDNEGRLAALTETPGGQARDRRPPDMTFESGGQGLWSTLDDYLAFARMMIGEGPAILRPETRVLMVSNQLTSEQRATARMFGQSLFAEGHGYGMGVAVVMEPEKADLLRCRGGVGTIGWPGAFGGWWQADPNDGAVLIFLAHNMVGLEQMSRGIGLGVWSTIAAFHAAASA
jgi:CubicO group peptidase (beta-lactamase class C family)